MGEPKDHYELSRVLARNVNSGDPEEVIFRYHLCQAIYKTEFDLPPLPSSTSRILELSRNPKTGASDYAKIIETDPALTREVLNLANSPFYGAKVRCTSVATALVRMGLREVERIALMQAFEARMFRVPGHNDLVGQISKHGLATALASQNVARRIRVSPEDAYLGGLFHDVGKLVILGIIGRVQRHLKRAASRGFVMEAFDAFHVAIGAGTCFNWDLPSSVGNATQNHHLPSAAAEDAVSQAVYLGNRIAHSLMVLNSGSQIASPDDPVIDAAGLTAADLEELRINSADEMRTYLRLLG